MYNPAFFRSCLFQLDDVDHLAFFSWSTSTIYVFDCIFLMVDVVDVDHPDLFKAVDSRRSSASVDVHFTALLITPFEGGRVYLWGVY